MAGTHPIACEARRWRIGRRGYARLIAMAPVFVLCMLQSLDGVDQPDNPIAWESLRKASRGEWLVTYSFNQGRDERIEGRPDLQRHRRVITIDHTGFLKVVKPSPGGFERERYLSDAERDMVLRDVLKLVEGYTLDTDQMGDVRTSETLVFRAGSKAVTINLTRAAMNDGIKLLHSIGSK